MKYVVALEVVEGQADLTDVEFDATLVKLDVLLYVIPEVAAQ